MAGFISTGSAAGSLKHSVCDVIRKIEFLDGNGQLHVAKPGTDLWAAVGVSMGLFGVITRVSFRLLQMRLVEGSESDHNLAESMLGLDKDGNSKLKESLEKNENMGVNWFPQKKVKRVQQWVGKRIFSGDTIRYKSVVSNILAAGMSAISLATCDFVLKKANPTEVDYDIIGAILGVFVPLEKPTRFRDTWQESLPIDNEA